MWPFKRKALAPSQLPVDGPWSVAERKSDGGIMIVRANTGYQQFDSIPGYDHQVGIAVPFGNAKASTSPERDMEVLSTLDRIEETICASLEAQTMSLLVAVITTGSMREFVLYTRDPRAVEQRVAELRKQSPNEELQLIIQPDPPWKIYKLLAPK